jgi:CYTH domain-containing protein
MSFQEIERKFLLQSLPDGVSETEPIHFERYYLFANQNIELRVQQKGELFEFERKVQLKENNLVRETYKIPISQEEFDLFKQQAIGNKIVFKKYKLPDSAFMVKEYEACLKGLILLELEFGNLDEATSFQPLEWMGKDISNSPFSRDSGLVNVNSLREISFES